MKKIIISFSGGLDSTILLAYFLNKGFEVICYHFQYGSKHNHWEKIAAKKIIDYYKEMDYPVSLNTLDISSLFTDVSSALLKKGGDIPEGHFTDPIMKETIVPGRNLIFSSILFSIAQTKNVNYIGLGVHHGDYTIYPDCRPLFFSALETAFSLISFPAIKIETPFILSDKTLIIETGDGLPISIPLQLTRTCYSEEKIACGKCAACVERKEAFFKARKTDPIKYKV